MKKLTNMLVGVFCASLLATSAYAGTTNAPVIGDWVFTVGANGATGTTRDGQTAFGLNMSAGRNLALFGAREEAGVRQSVGYASSDGGTTLASTRLYADVVVLSFNLSQNVPVDVYAGGNVGMTYGNTTLKWIAAPELGVDIWLAKNVAIDGRIDYAFDLNSGRSENVLEYTIGVKFRL